MYLQAPQCVAGWSILCWRLIKLVKIRITKQVNIIFFMVETCRLVLNQIFILSQHGVIFFMSRISVLCHWYSRIMRGHILCKGKVALINAMLQQIMFHYHFNMNQTHRNIQVCKHARILLTMKNLSCIFENLNATKQN